MSASRRQYRNFEIDRRAEERKSVTIPAMVFPIIDRNSLLRPLLTDQKSGAKIKIEQNLFLPKIILLVDFHSNSVFECEVRWREDCYLGVLIIDAYGSARRRRFFQTHRLRNCGGLAVPRAGAVTHGEDSIPRDQPRHNRLHESRATRKERFRTTTIRAAIAAQPAGSAERGGRRCHVDRIVRLRNVLSDRVSACRAALKRGLFHSWCKVTATTCRNRQRTRDNQLWWGCTAQHHDRRD